MFVTLNQLAFTPALFCERHTPWYEIYNFVILDRICSKSVFTIQNRRNEQNNRIYHI